VILGEQEHPLLRMMRSKFYVSLAGNERRIAIWCCVTHGRRRLIFRDEWKNSLLEYYIGLCGWKLRKTPQDRGGFKVIITLRAIDKVSLVSKLLSWIQRFVLKEKHTPNKHPAGTDELLKWFLKKTRKPESPCLNLKEFLQLIVRENITVNKFAEAVTDSFNFALYSKD